MIINVSTFQPFESRQGVDTVFALRFRYDPDLVALLKSALRAARRRGLSFNPGGWLPNEHCWFVERSAWPYVRDFLAQEGGCRFAGPEADARQEEDSARRKRGDEHRKKDDAQRKDAPSAVRSAVKQWYWRLSLKYHPDRGGSQEQMKVVNDAYEQILELLGVSR
jgi:hypothetical protein